MSGTERDLDSPHRRPDSASDDLVAAVGRVSEAWETIERARGRLFDFHQLTGHAHLLLIKAVEQLRAAGAPEAADLVERELVGLNVLEGRWTFQIVEEYDTVYYDTMRDAVAAITQEHMEGRRHVFEAELKQRVRVDGQPGQEANPLD